MVWSIIKDTFVVVWKHKTVWLIGAFIAFVGTLEETELLRQLSLTQGPPAMFDFWNDLRDTNIFSAQGFSGLIRLFENKPFIFFQIVFLLVLVLAFTLFILWLSLVSQGSAVLLFHSQHVLRGASIKKILQLGRKKFFSILNVNIAAKILLLALWWFFSKATVSASLPFFVVLLVSVVFLLLYLMLSFFLKYAVCGIMIQHYGTIRSLVNAMRIFWSHIGTSMALALSLFGIYLVTALAFMVLTALLLLPFFLIMTAAFLLKWNLVFMAAFFVFVLCATALFFLLYGFFTSLSWGSWTRLYTTFNGGKH